MKPGDLYDRAMLPGTLYDGCFLVIQARPGYGRTLPHVLALWNGRLLDHDLHAWVGQDMDTMVLNGTLMVSRWHMPELCKALQEYRKRKTGIPTSANP